MKRALTILMAVLMIFVIAGCGGSSGGNSGAAGAFDFDSYQTIGELMDLQPESVQWGTSDNDFIYGFEWEGSYYRVRAEMTDEQRDALMNVDYGDEDYEEQQDAIISEFQIVERQELDSMIISQDELDTLAGKTGKELLDEGWATGYGYNLSEGEFWMYNGPFTYAVRFEGDFSDVEDIYDEEEFIQDLVVISAEFMGSGDVTNW